MRVFEAAPDVGGTWYFNRYPGARCDVESVDYCYSFSDELQQEWNWTEKYATQAEILRYLNWVADKLDLRTRHHVQHPGDVGGARRADVALDGDHRHRRNRDRAVLRDGDRPAVGGDDPEVPRAADIRRASCTTPRTGRMRPSTSQASGSAVIGTGSSGIQSIPIIAEQAAQLYVFQRTPNYSVPAGNKPLTAEDIAEYQGELR